MGEEIDYRDLCTPDVRDGCLIVLSDTEVSPYTETIRKQLWDIAAAVDDKLKPEDRVINGMTMDEYFYLCEHLED